jgi:nicotinamide mononucleotide transporter
MTSPWEITAVALAVAYLVLAIRQSVLCWPAAIGSTTIYIFLMYNAALYMESALQVFYIAIAVYGWLQWTRGLASPLPAESGTGPAAATLPMGECQTIHEASPAGRSGGRSGVSRDSFPPTSISNAPALRVTTWPWQRHLVAVATILLASVVSGALLAHYTDAAFPYADSFTTWGAIVTTWMVARKILENWLYWFVIDSVSVFLYISRELYLTAGLFMLYLVLVVVGFISWRKSMASGTGAGGAEGHASAPAGS